MRPIHFLCLSTVVVAFWVQLFVSLLQIVSSSSWHQGSSGSDFTKHSLIIEQHGGGLSLFDHSSTGADHLATDQLLTAADNQVSNNHEGSSSNSNNNQHDSDYYYPEHNNNNNDQQEQTFETTLSSNSNRLPEKEYLSHDLAEKACRLDRGCQRKDRLNNTYLGYCTRYKLENLFSNEILDSIMHDSVEECDKILDEFIQLDELINQFDTLFKNLLTRYNCHNGYSVKWSCEDCKKAYKDWLCATNLPFYMNGERIKPCISFCERVEQRCPYLHPITKEQYGGQPVFICRDPNIPFVPEITPDIPYSEPTKCYDLCHLTNNETELLSDSLSKYDHDKCPTRGSIAEEVRSDPLYCKLGLQQSLAKDQNRTTEPKVDTQNLDIYEPDSQTEYPIIHEDETNSAKTTNETVHGKDRVKSKSGKHSHVHIKKLDELKEVLTVNAASPHSKHWSTPRTHHSPAAKARR